MRHPGKLTIIIAAIAVFFLVSCTRSMTNEDLPYEHDELTGIFPVVYPAPEADGCLYGDLVQDFDSSDNALSENENLPDEYPEGCEVEVVQLSLGDRFMYQTMEITLGDEVKFIYYTRIFDFDTERAGRFPFWQHKGEQREKAIYIPVAVKDTAEDTHQVGRYIWMLMDAHYYPPGMVDLRRTAWHNPGGEKMMHFFPWSLGFVDSVCGNYTFEQVINEPYAESHIRLTYTGDGEYILRFHLIEKSGWDTWNIDIVKIFELSLDIFWPETPEFITVAHIERQPYESVLIGNLKVVVGSKAFTCADVDPCLAVGITLFPVSLTNTGVGYEYLSSLKSMRLNSNCGYPVPITSIRYNGADIQMSEVPPLAAGAGIQFYLPIHAVVCENSAIFRPFRLTEIDIGDQIVITHNHYEFCLPWCSWCDYCY